MSAPAASSVRDLLERARAGDRAALDRLFALCHSYVRIVAQAQVESWLRAKVDASDLAQQTLLDAYRAFGQFEGATSAEWLAWLRRILEHNAADFVRTYHGTAKRQVGREVSLDGPASLALAGNGESPSQALLRKESELLMADALARLSDDHREVILLRNLQRLPFDEVARRMGRTRPAVQMLWMRALRKLQDEMAGAALPTESMP
jgi:RNA polymerase sigma-70 factor (ECF subfamily)